MPGGVGGEGPGSPVLPYPDYRTAAEAPSQYGGGFGGCGVIVLWTKDPRLMR